MDNWTDRDLDNLKNLTAKHGCVMLTHPSATSHQSPTEQIIAQFRKVWSSSGFYQRNYNLFEFLTCVRATDFVLNNRCLVLLSLIHI